MKLDDDQIKILLHLVKNEMAGFCGDQGYAELAQIKIKLEEQLAKNDVNDK